MKRKLLSYSSHPYTQVLSKITYLVQRNLLISELNIYLAFVEVIIVFISSTPILIKIIMLFSGATFQW